MFLLGNVIISIYGCMVLVEIVFKTNRFDQHAFSYFAQLIIYIEKHSI